MQIEISGTKIIMGLLGLVASALITVSGWLVKATLDGIQSDIESNKVAMEADLNEIKADIATVMSAVDDLEQGQVQSSTYDGTLLEKIENVDEKVEDLKERIP